MASPAPVRELPPPLELECLKALWTLGHGSVHQVRDAVAPVRLLAYTTVMTVLDRLSKRGCVRREKSGRSFVYAPVLTREEVRHMAVRELVEMLFDGRPETLRQYLLRD